MSRFKKDDLVVFIKDHAGFGIRQGDTGVVIASVDGFGKDGLFLLKLHDPSENRGVLWHKKVYAYPDEIVLKFPKVEFILDKKIERDSIPFGTYETLWKEMVG